MRCLVTALALCCLLVTGVASALACSCMIQWTPTELYDESDLVFAGRIQSITPHANGYDVQVVVQTHAVWKGLVQSSYTLVTPAEESMCGYPFEVDQEYFIYAEDSGDGSYYTHLCGRNRPMMYADEDMAELGAPLVVPTRDITLGMVKARFGER